MHAILCHGERFTPLDTLAPQCISVASITPCFSGAGQAGSHDGTPQQGIELLSTCDGRIQALLAEADLLGQPVQPGSSSAAEAALEAEVRQAFASILIESGEQIRGMCLWIIYTACGNQTFQSGISLA